MARVQCFCETLFGSECTQIERRGDDDLSHFECAIFTCWHAYELQATSGLVRLMAERPDSTLGDPTLIAEVQTVDERSMAIMRSCISALEALSELRQTRKIAELHMLQKAIGEALGVPYAVASGSRETRRRRKI